MQRPGMRGLPAGLLIGLLGIVIRPGLAAGENGDYPLPFDTKAIFRSHVAHLNSQVGGGNGSGGGHGVDAAAIGFAGAR